MLNKMEFLLFVGFLTIQGCGAYNKTMYPSIEAETQLLHDLMANYDRRVRPAMKPSDTVHASFGLAPKAVLHLDESKEYLETISYQMTSWVDVRLSWNQSKYQDIGTFKIPARDIWTSDFVPYTSIDEDVHLMDTSAFVYNSGQVNWVSTLRLRSSCEVNLRDFPFDKQKCTINFASYIYHGDQLNITYFGGTPWSALDVTGYKANTYWTLVDHKAEIKVLKFPCCPESYPRMQIELVFKRNPDFYLYLFILPALLLGFLVPVTLLMPPESKERVTISSVVILALLLLNTKLCDVIPSAHNQLPALCLYYALTLIWTVLSLVGSIFVLNLHNRGPRKGKVPETIRWIFLRGLKRLVCLGNDSYYPLTDMDAISMRGLDKTPTPQERQLANQDSRTVSPSKMEKDIEEIGRSVNILSARFSLQDARQEVLNEWRQVALVMDRVLFFLFILAFLMCSVILLA